MQISFPELGLSFVWAVLGVCALWNYALPLGYGASSGAEPTEKATYADIEAAVLFASTECPETQIVLFGESVGSGPSCWMACNQTRSAWKRDIMRLLCSRKSSEKMPEIAGLVRECSLK